MLLESPSLLNVEFLTSDELKVEAESYGGRDLEMYSGQTLNVLLRDEGSTKI
jgi:hypothetical protein